MTRSLFESLEPRQLLSAAITTLTAANNVPIANVGALWTSAAPTIDQPIADDLTGNAQGVTINVNLNTDGATSLTVNYAWSIAGTSLAGAGAQSIAQGASGSQSRAFNVALPSTIGQYNLNLKIWLTNPSNQTLASTNTTHRLYVTYAAPTTADPLNYLQRATAWAVGTYGPDNTPDGILRNLVMGFRTAGWKYFDNDTAANLLLNGQANSGNCFAMVGVFNVLSGVLGIPTGSLPITASPNGSAFFTAQATMFDGERGTAHLPGQGNDKFYFIQHDVATYNGRYYDPTFGKTYDTPKAFIDWYVNASSTATTNGEASLIHLSNGWQYTLAKPDLTDDPFLGSPLQLPGTIQAEDFDAGRDGVTYHDTDPANDGNAYRNTGVDLETTAGNANYDLAYTKAGEWLQYTVNASQSATYNVDFRVASLGAGGSFHLTIDGKSDGPEIFIPNTNGFQSWQTITAAGINLTAGIHKLRIVFDSNGASGYAGNVDSFRAYTGAPTRPPTTPPVTPPPSNFASILIQAEDYAPGGEGVGYHDTDSINVGGAYRNDGVDIQPTNDVGGGYDVGWISPGEWLKYTTTITKPGTYQANFRVSNFAPGGSFRLEIDGKIAGTINVPNTGSFQNWTTVSLTNLSLTAGVHTLRLLFDKASTATAYSYVGDVNWLQLLQIA